jgi:hypothetical protein
MSMNKIANHYYALGRRDAFSKMAGVKDLGLLEYLGLTPSLPPLAVPPLVYNEIVEPGIMAKVKATLPDVSMPNMPTLADTKKYLGELGDKIPSLGDTKKYFGDLGGSIYAYAKQNPYKVGGGVVGTAAGLYGAKKLYDYLTEEEAPAAVPVPVPVPVAPAAPSRQEQMLALAKQYGPQAAAALAATGALYGGYRALKSRDRKHGH